MALEQVNSALIQAYVVAMPTMPSAFDNMDNFTPPDDELWAQVNFVDADNNAVTLGDYGDDETIGYLQIVLYGIPGNGIAQFLEAIDTLKKTFRNGASFVYDSQYVTVTRSRTTPLRSVNGVPVKVVQFFWRARIKRND